MAPGGYTALPKREEYPPRITACSGFPTHDPTKAEIEAENAALKKQVKELQAEVFRLRRRR